MLILLDCRFLQYDMADREPGRMIASCALRLSDGSGIEWLFLVDKSYQPGSLPGIPGSQVVTRKAFPGNTGWKIWYDWQVPSVAKKYKPDLVMTTGGLAAARLHCPQCLWIPEPGREAGSKGKDPGSRYPVRQVESLRRADLLFTFSEKTKKYLVDHSVDLSLPGKIRVVRPAPDEGSVPLLAGEQQIIKEQYTGGREFFFTDISGVHKDQVIGLLKAFSLFKKRQHSNMQLILAGKGSGPDSGLDVLLETYKYREDVHRQPALPGIEWTRLAGAAYAIVSPFHSPGLGISILNAWQAGVPVIVKGLGSLPESAGDAVLPAGEGDPVSLAGLLMQIYKDEGLRSVLIARGKALLPSFNAERCDGEVRAGIRMAVADGKSAINS